MVTYLDSSVALAHIFDEARSASAAFWDRDIVSSRLTQYEVWNRVHVYGTSNRRQDRARVLLQRIEWIEMAPDILMRSLSPFPVAVRTLDGLHLATLDHITSRQRVEATLASYDRRLLAAADAMGFPTVEP